MKKGNRVSTREASAIQEYRVAKKLGGKLSSNSGGGRFEKGDIKIPESSLNIECKTCMSPKKSFSIKKEWIEKNKEEAFRSRLYNQVLSFNFDFEDEHDYYVIDDKLMKFLVEKLREDLAE